MKIQKLLRFNYTSSTIISSGFIFLEKMGRFSPPRMYNGYCPYSSSSSTRSSILHLSTLLMRYAIIRSMLF